MARVFFSVGGLPGEVWIDYILPKVHIMRLYEEFRLGQRLVMKTQSAWDGQLICTGSYPTGWQSVLANWNKYLQEVKDARMAGKFGFHHLTPETLTHQCYHYSPLMQRTKSWGDNVTY